MHEGNYGNLLGDPCQMEAGLLWIFGYGKLGKDGRKGGSVHFFHIFRRGKHRNHWIQLIL